MWLQHAGRGLLLHFARVKITKNREKSRKIAKIAKNREKRENRENPAKSRTIQKNPEESRRIQKNTQESTENEEVMTSDKVCEYH